MKKLAILVLVVAAGLSFAEPTRPTDPSTNIVLPSPYILKNF